MIKVLYKIYGPSTAEDPFGIYYISNPQPTYIEGIIQSNGKLYLLGGSVIIEDPVEGTDYRQYKIKTGFDNSRLSALNTFLQNNKNDATLGPKCQEMIALGQLGTRIDVIDFCAGILANGSNAAKLAALNILEIMWLIKISDDD